MAKPLDGVTVVELATFVAAPVCGRLLADLGARVIKVEAPAGDTWRSNGIRYVSNRFCEEENPVFDIYNTGKEFVALNLKTPEGKEAMLKLLDSADVFLTNTRAAGLNRLGLSYEDVSKRCPNIIYAILVGYGENGPEAANPAFDSTAFWSKSGFLYDQAPVTNDYMPISPPFGAGDTVTGYLMLAEICAALYRKKCTGKGDRIASSLFHNGIFCFGTMNIINQKPFKPFGLTYPVTRVQHGVPGGMYRCSDGEWVYVGISSAAALIPVLCQAIGKPELADDPTCIGPNFTIVDRDKLYPYFRDEFLRHTSDYWLEKSKELDFPLVRVNRYSNVLEDPQAWANGYVEKVEFSTGNADLMPSSPIEMESVGKLKTVPSGPIGANTRQILADLGYTTEQIDAMLAAGAAV